MPFVAITWTPTSARAAHVENLPLRPRALEYGASPCVMRRNSSSLWLRWLLAATTLASARAFVLSPPTCLCAARRLHNLCRPQLSITLPAAASSTLVRFAEDANAFRAALQPADVAQIALARNMFHASWLLPLIVYVLCEPRKTRLFPMSISWTIRAGLPRKLNNVLWVTGWSVFLSVVLRVSGGFGRSTISTFVAQMMATGACATILCPLGSGRRLQDAVHWLAALAYMIDHIFLFGVLRTPARYIYGFWTCFALMVAAQPSTVPDARRVELRKRRRSLTVGAPDDPRRESESGGDRMEPTDDWIATDSANENGPAEWVFMLGEYGLFVFFLNGMVSGLS